MTQIRPYIAADKPALLALLRHHIPSYFHPSEEGDFMDYLEQEVEDYFVWDTGKEIVGCGGINYFPPENQARISWDLVHPDHQGKGLGSQLLQFRIQRIRTHSVIKEIVVRTSQLAYPFYQKNGFILQATEKDYWAAGFELYYMRLELP